MLDLNDKKLFGEIEVLTRLVAEFKVTTNDACPLLEYELNQLQVLSDVLTRKVRSLRTSVNRIINKGKE